MTSQPASVVFDCNVLLQALLKPGPAFACVELLDAARIIVSLSAETIAEARDVLNRPKLRAKFPVLTPEKVKDFLDHVEGKAVVVADVPKVFTLDRDPKDEKYADLAVAAGATYLVSRDNDLLDLMKEDEALPSSFRARFPKLIILDPVQFLQVRAAAPAS